MSAIIHPALPEGWTLHVLDESDAFGQRDVLEFWARERVLGADEAFRRVGEAFIVAVDDQQSVIGVVSTYLEVNQQVRAPLWHLRGFVAASHRQSNAALVAVTTTIEVLEERFLSGAGRTASGVCMTLENEGLARHYPEAVAPHTYCTYVGDSPSGAPTFLRWFVGATVPGASTASA